MWGPGSLCYPLYAPASIYYHNNQRRNLCTLHNFRRWFIAFCRPSQFSDSKGQRFVSPRTHREQCFLALLFLFCMKLFGIVARLDSNSCIGDRRQRRKQGAGAGSRSRGRGRRGQAPPKGRRPMRAPQPVLCPSSTFRRAKAKRSGDSGHFVLRSMAGPIQRLHFQGAERRSRTPTRQGPPEVLPRLSLPIQTAGSPGDRQRFRA